METYKLSEFAAHGVPGPFVQDNWSHSRRGMLRGLHYQKAPKAQGKLVMALSGEMLDVAVDIRRGSPTYGRWVAETLSAGDGRALYVPPGFAHGFCVLSETADFIYKVTEEYAPDLDAGNPLERSRYRRAVAHRFAPPLAQGCRAPAPPGCGQRFRVG